MVNYPAVLVTAIVGYIIGAIWYSPILFGKQWMKLSEYTNKDVDKAKKDGKMGLRYSVMFLSTLVMSYVLAVFVDLTTGAASYGSYALGLLTGFWLWLGFLATTMLSMVLWNNKPFALYPVMAAHYLVALAVRGGILAVWS